jgi:hypothetical protein
LRFGDFKVKRILALLLLPVMASACVHSLVMRSRDGEELSGRYRLAREDTGLIEVIGSDSEILTGKFVRVGRGVFVDRYRQTFGSGSIAVDGPDLPASAFSSLFGSSYALTDAAYGDTFDNLSGNTEIVVKGPLFYWTAFLTGDKGTIMGCYFIGTYYTGHGFGRCKTDTGKEYSARF